MKILQNILILRTKREISVFICKRLCDMTCNLVFFLFYIFLFTDLYSSNETPVFKYTVYNTQEYRQFLTKI